MAEHAYLKKAKPRSQQADRAVVERVRAMLEDIEANRDAAVRRYAEELDRWESPEFRVSAAEVDAARKAMSTTFKDDFAYCKSQITEFARRQRESLSEFETEVGDGITLGQKIIPVETVGCYIPGGKYPLISAAIMSVATAKVAGVPHVIGAAPPRDGAGIFPATLYALAESGADEIYAIGGVQAFGAMAYGCVGMRPVDMITGPGNPYVAEAKRQLFGHVGIDLPAGPTEILVIADDSADPALIATDLLGQAEHGPDSPAWLITTSEKFGRAVLSEIERQLLTLPTREIAAVSWANLGEVAVVADDDAAIALSDQYAPEHLEVQTHRNDYYLAKLQELRQPVPRRGEHRGLRRQGRRHQPHAADGARRALHRRPVGRQVPEDRHLAEAHGASEPAPRPRDRPHVRCRRHAGPRAHRRRCAWSATRNGGGEGLGRTGKQNSLNAHERPVC